MKKIIITKYECEVCNMQHYREAEALKCEGFKIEPCGFTIGDDVKVKEDNGQFHGQQGKITKFQLTPDTQKRIHFVSAVILDDVFGIAPKRVEKVKNI